jgi:hypothetical protein
VRLGLSDIFGRRRAVNAVTLGGEADPHEPNGTVRTRRPLFALSSC